MVSALKEAGRRVVFDLEKQTVRDLKGVVLSERTVCHIFRIEDGLIKRFDIGQAA